MMLAAALAILLATGSSDLLDEARSAFAAADYARAERLALEAASRTETPAPALYLAGLARFRDGRPAEALEALDRAEAGADTPAGWHYNRGACLYDLGRHQEAQGAFLEAARDPALAAVALVNAGFAALDGGDPAQARTLATRARAAAAGGAALPLVEELEQALEGGAATAPTGPPPASWTFQAGLGGGWDSDASQAGNGAVERPGSGPGVASGFATAAAALAWQSPGAGGTGASVTLDLGQLAYLEAGAQDYSVLQQDLVLALRHAPSPGLQLELALLGQYALAGLEDLRGLQAAGGGRLAAALVPAPDQVTRAELSFTWKDGQGSEFASLDGTRLEVVASHEVRLAGLLLRAAYRFQLEQIGEVATARPPDLAEVQRCGPDCIATDVEPLSYAGHTGWLAAHLEAADLLRFDLSAGLEWRQYLHDLRTVLTPPDGPPQETRQQQRTDLRGSTSAAAALRLASWAWLTLRYDWLVNRTQLETSQEAPVGMMGRRAGSPTWDKQVLTAGVTASW